MYYIAIQIYKILIIRTSQFGSRKNKKGLKKPASPLKDENLGKKFVFQL